MSQTTVAYWSNLNIKTGPVEGLRSRFAWWFRRLATAIDRKATLTVSMTASHDIPRKDCVDIMAAGFTHMKALYEERVKQEAIDEAMDASFPELRGDE